MKHLLLALIILAGSQVPTACESRFISSDKGSIRADSLVDMAKRENDKDSYAKAYGYLLEAVSLYDKVGDEGGKANAHAYMALVFYGLGQIDKTAEQLAEAKKGIQLMSPHAKSMFYRISAINIIDQKHDLRSGAALMQQAIEVDKGMKNKLYYYQDLSNFAEIFIRSNNIKKADSIIKIVEQNPLCRQQSYYTQILYCRTLIAQHEGQRQETYRQAMLCRESAKHYRQPHLLVAALEIIKDIDRERQDYPAYADHLEQFIAIRDSLTGSSTAYRIAQLQEQQKIEVAQLKLSRRHQAIIMTISISLLVMACLTMAFILLYRKAREKHRIAELEAQRLDSEVNRQRLERELLELKMNIERQQLEKSKEDVVSMSLQLASVSEKEGKKRFLHLFDEHYRLIDNDLCDQLLHDHPALTPTEIRLICFLKMNMTTDEILKVLNISHDSFYKLRYRLRQHLKMKKGESLERFIASL